MDRLDSLRLFTRIVERRSFTAAATDLGVPRSTATLAIRQLEARLGVRLLERTTRLVSATLDGQAFYQRALAILADVEDAENALRGAEPKGLLRIDVSGMLARTFLLPRLPDFLDRYPRIDLHIGQGDRLVDLVREGVDCVLRAGAPAESGMVMRRIASMREVTCASPAYLEQYGAPATLDDLAGHQMIGFVSSKSGQVMPLEFTLGSEVREVSLPSRITVDNSDTLADLARLGFGIVQAPRYRFEADLAHGVLVEVLPANPPTPTPLSALYPQNRQLSPRVRAFLDWVVELFASANL